MNSENLFSFASPELRQILNENATIQKFPANTELLREGQYVKVIPLVLEGLIKVFSRFDTKELLLYYIQPEESCIMSFSSGLRREPSKVFAVTEEESLIALLPSDKVESLVQQHPDFNKLFFQQYNQRYGELLETIHQVLFNRMDVRIIDFLRKRSQLLHQNPLKISHARIAAELGTAREVVSRAVKRLETEGTLAQTEDGIKLL